ncbi:MAG: hypothetical protein ACJ72O_07535 [Marmoricola sp.]
MSRIWLYGKSNNQVYLYDTESGAHRGFPNRTYRGATAGDFSRMSGKDVATYVDEKGQIIWLQIGRDRYPLDERTTAVEGAGVGGLLKSLTVTSVGLPTVRLTERAPARRLHAIATLIDSPQARETFRTVKNPGGGPGIEAVRAGGIRPEPSLGI